MTRRTLLAFLAGALRRPLAASPLGAERRYRADAVIKIFSVPIYSRAGVGSAYAWFAASEAAGSRSLVLGFAGGSWPERAKGLNRLGCLEERVVEEASGIREAGYFGFMTSSPEETLQEARKALASNAQAMPIAAIEVSMSRSACRTRKTHLWVDGRFGWSNLGVLAPHVHRALSETPGEDVTGGPAPPPFLYSISRAMRAGRKRTEAAFSYQGRLFRLSGEIRNDRGMGARFREKGLAADERTVFAFDGRIVSGQDGKSTKFRLWFDTSGLVPLPLRIEYQPRSFLQLVFETDTSLPALRLQALPGRKWFGSAGGVEQETLPGRTATASTGAPRATARNQAFPSRRFAKATAS